MTPPIRTPCCRSQSSLPQPLERGRSRDSIGFPVIFCFCTRVHVVPSPVRAEVRNERHAALTRGNTRLMRLADFILANTEPILAEWEVFARSIWPGAATDPATLRDHAEAMLRATVSDMQSDQTAREQ